VPFILFIFLFFPTAEQLRMKSGKTMVALCGCRGKASFAEA